MLWGRNNRLTSDSMAKETGTQTDAILKHKIADLRDSAQKINTACANMTKHFKAMFAEIQQQQNFNPAETGISSFSRHESKSKEAMDKMLPLYI